MRGLYLVVSLVTTLCCASVYAEGDLRTSINFGYEPSASPEFGGHGWALVRADREGLLPRGARLSVEYNTDTLRLSIDRARFDRLELEGGIVGEAILAGVLTDYWRDGKDEGARAFTASYVGAIGGAKVDLAPHFVEFTAGFRRWIFTRWTDTDKALILPPEAWVGELRFRYTYWNVKPDPSLWEPQRPFWRVRGFAFGAEASIDFRSQVYAWGARDPSVFGPVDPRNNPSTMVVGVHQWMRVGVQATKRIRLQAREEAHVLWGADDLDRVRIGGMNPYVVPLAGATWPAYLADRVAGFEGSIHVKVKGEQEIGVLVDAVVLNDVRRVGAENMANWLTGIGAFADLRLRGFQLDIRTGWSPTVRPGNDKGGFTFLVAAGWGGVRKK